MERVSLTMALIRFGGASRTINESVDDADNRFLECAEAARADFLVTGNKRHFPKRWNETQVVNARELVEMIGLSFLR